MTNCKMMKKVYSMQLVASKKTPFLIAPMCLAAMLICQPAFAISLSDAFTAAKNFDPKYQAAKSEKNANTAQGVRDTSAYLPVLGFSQQQFPTYTTAYKSQSVNQPLFDAATSKAPAFFWMPDGVHPSAAGHQLIADSWMARASLLFEGH
jgi:lysophospholipase L1-like esterase